jgi:hypothetical protein
MNLQQFRTLQLSPTLQRLGEWVGGVIVLCWFWWVLIEKGAWASLLGGPELMEILLGLPLILILPAILYTMVFLLLRVWVWLRAGAVEPDQECG